MLKTIVGAMALAAAFPANAGTDLGNRVVRFDDLNLASPTGMARLERRIDAAARGVCDASSTRALPPSEAMARRSCVTRAKDDARQQIASLDLETTLGG